MPAVSSAATARARRQDPRGWTENRRVATSDYVARLASALHLSDWHISVNFTVPADAGAYAEIVPHANQRRAEIRFGVAFNSLDAPGVRQTLVHELLHCHLFAPHHLAEEMLMASAGDKKSALGLIALDASIESATDAIAEAFAAVLPLPPRSVLPPSYASTVLPAKVRPMRAARRQRQR